MAPPNRATLHPHLRSSSGSKSLKVILKVSVADQDLASGRYRQPAPVTPAPRVKRKYTRRSTVQSSQPPTPSRRNKRRRTIKTNAKDEDTITIDEATAQIDKLDAEEREDQWRQQHYPDSRLRFPSLSDFEQVSDFSFPVLKSTCSWDRSVGQQTQKAVETTPVRARDHGSVPCADCGVPLPRNDHTVDADNDVMTPAPTMALTSPPPSLSPWKYLDLQPRRCVTPGLSSVTDRAVTRSGPLPQTAGFWYDLTIAEHAKYSDNLDFKMMCLNLIRWRVGNCCESEMIALRTAQTCENSRGDCWSMGWEWDLVLADAVAKGKIWRRRRRLQGKECEKAAGWAVWEKRQRRGSRGEFVEDHHGAWTVRAPGLDGDIKKILCLGYKREGNVKNTNDMARNI